MSAYGKNGYREIVERNCSLAQDISKKIKNSEKFTLLSDVILNGVCFTLNKKEITIEIINEFITKLKENGEIFITPTIYNNTPALRISITNWQTNTKDIGIAWEALNNAYNKL